MWLHPHESSIPDDYDTLEHTGSAEEFSSIFEEGNDNGMLSQIINSKDKDTPTIIEEDDTQPPTQNVYDSSSDIPLNLMPINKDTQKPWTSLKCKHQKKSQNFLNKISSLITQQ